MKATVFTTIYNKEECFENTLFSLFLQVTDFDWELRVYDDCSRVDQEPLVRKYFPNAYYERIDKHVPFDAMMSYCLGGESEVVVMMSADVMLAGHDVLKTVVDNVARGQASFATVFNSPVKSAMYRKWDEHLKTLWANIGRKVPVFRSSPYLGTRYFFFGGILRADLKKMNANKPWCDIMLDQRMKDMNAVWPKQTFGIHQDHAQTTLPCTRIDECTITPCWLKRRIKGE